MSATTSIPVELTGRVEQLLNEIKQVEGARPTIESECAAETARLDMLTVRATPR